MFAGRLGFSGRVECRCESRQGLWIRFGLGLKVYMWLLAGLHREQLSTLLIFEQCGLLGFGFTLLRARVGDVFWLR